MPTRRRKVKFVKKTSNKRTKQPQTQELTRLGAALRTLGGLGGRLAGGMLGQAEQGSAIGTGLGASLSRFLGSGDYTVSSNSIVSSSLKGSSNIPAMHKTDQSIVVRHREFIGTINGSEEFAVARTYEINPGLASTFPWLSAIAGNYQEYLIRGLVFHYVPTSGPYTSSGSQLGAVMIQTAYRASDSAPSTKYELLNEYWANECLPSESMVHPLECKKSETVLGMRYIRTGTVTDDLMFYDYGKTTIATQGNPNTGVIGDLWVTYEIELKKPRMYATLGKDTLTAKWVNVTAAPTTYWSGAALGFNSFTGTPVVTSPGTNAHRLILPAGNAGSFTLSVQITATSAAFSGSPATLHDNAVPMLVGTGVTSQYYFSNSSTGFAVYYTAFRVVDPTKQAILDLSGLILNFSGSASVAFVLNEIDADAPSA